MNNFDDILIICSINELTKEINDKINYIKNYLNNDKIIYKIVNNSKLYREGITFYNEIICDKYDGIVLFAHSKGLYDLKKFPFNCNQSSIYDWIIGMYFQVFYNIKEIDKALSNGYAASGAYNVIETSLPLRYKYRYQGSYCWYNINLLKEKLDNDWKEYFDGSNSYAITVCAEDFIGNYLNPKYCHYLFNTLTYDDAEKYNPYINSNTLYATMNKQQIRLYNIYKQYIYILYNNEINKVNVK